MPIVVCFGLTPYIVVHVAASTSLSSRRGFESKGICMGPILHAVPEIPDSQMAAPEIFDKQLAVPEASDTLLAVPEHPDTELASTPDDTIKLHALRLIGGNLCGICWRHSQQLVSRQEGCLHPVDLLVLASLVSQHRLVCCVRLSLIVHLR